MTAIKVSSTNFKNKQENRIECPVTFTLEMIGGRWKVLILYQLTSGTLRYSELKRRIPSATEKMLIQQLKQLELDGLISREAKDVVPPYVEYKLTAAGKALTPVLKAMSEWGRKFNK